MKHTLILCFYIFSNLQILFSQNSFSFIYGKISVDEYPTEVFELSSGNFVGIINSFDPRQQSKYSFDKISVPITKLIEFNNFGEVLKITELPNYAIFGIKKLDDKYFGYGYFQPDSNIQIVSLLFDNDFKIIRENKNFLPYYNPINNGTQSGILDYCIAHVGNKFYCPISVGNLYPISIKTICYIFSEDADSLSSVLINGYIHDISPKPSCDGFLLSGFFYDYPSSMGTIPKIAYTDTLLNIYKADSIDIRLSSFALLLNVKTLKEHILISGRANDFYVGNFIGAGIFDTTTTKLFYNTFGNNNYRPFAAVRNGICIDINNNIFISGTIGYTGFSYEIQNNYIVIAKTDSVLNKKWEYLVGGDAYYELYDIALCSDEGIILSTIRYDENYNNYDYDVCYYKVDVNGNILKIQFDKNLGKPVLISPNPATTEINIQKAAQLNDNTEIAFYDLSGKLVLNQRLTSQSTTINISHLPAGMYIYKCYTHERIVESGKMIKKD